MEYTEEQALQMFKDLIKPCWKKVDYNTRSCEKTITYEFTDHNFKDRLSDMFSKSKEVEKSWKEMEYKKGKKITDIYQFEKGQKYFVSEYVLEFSHLGKIRSPYFVDNGKYFTSADEYNCAGFKFEAINFHEAIEIKEELPNTGIEKRVKSRLIARGFSKDTLLNNRGLIGAAIDETILDLINTGGASHIINKL